MPIANAMEPPTSGASRHSCHPVIPSTRADRMNENRSKDITNKENQAASNQKVLPTSLPEWMQAALVHLSSCDLGKDWHIVLRPGFGWRKSWSLVFKER
jgi:dihydropteroate synthase